MLVEHAQLDPDNPFENVVRSLKADQQRVTELEAAIVSVLHRLSTLQLDRSHGVRDFVFSAAEVDTLLHTSQKLRELGEGVDSSGKASDVAIEILRETDGSVVVLPAYRAQTA